jgi:hypothetical protein
LVRCGAAAGGSKTGALQPVNKRDGRHAADHRQ